MLKCKIWNTIDENNLVYSTVGANKMNEFEENYEYQNYCPDLSKWIIKKETGENIELFANKLCAKMTLIEFISNNHEWCTLESTERREDFEKKRLRLTPSFLDLIKLCATFFLNINVFIVIGANYV